MWGSGESESCGGMCGEVGKVRVVGGCVGKY